jgi:cytosine/adenosine deaminase-related metal-dependent hydrolase
MAFTLIQNGNLYSLDHKGTQSILVVDRKIVKIGTIDLGSLRALGVPLEVIDASGMLVLPGMRKMLCNFPAKGDWKGRLTRTLLSWILRPWM